MKNCNERSHRAGHLRDAHAPERVKVSIDFAISAPNPLLSSNAELGDLGQRSASAQRWSLAAIAATGGFSNTLRPGAPPVGLVLQSPRARCGAIQQSFELT